MNFRKNAVILVLVLTIAVFITSIPNAKAAIIPTSMSASLSSNPICYGQQVTITAYVSPPPPRGEAYEISFETIDPNQNWYQIGWALSDSNGVASIGFQPPIPGTYTLFLSFYQTTFGSDIYQASSTSITLQVDPGPWCWGDFSISSSPPTQTVYQGESTTYEVTLTSHYEYHEVVQLDVSGLPTDATGSFNPTTVTPTGTSTLTVNTAATTPTGTYTLTIAAAEGGIFHSTDVDLTVIQSLAASATPASNAVTVGQSATFSVSASGGITPYSYQWYEGTTALSGETSYQLTVTEGVGSYSYYCRVGDSGGRTVNSNTVSLTVVPQLTASATPASDTVVTGESATFSVSASGGQSPYTYQWYEGTTLLTGATSSQLTVTKSTVGSYSYYCRVGDSGGRTVNSNTVSLTVVDSLTASATPTSETVTTGESATFTVSVAGGTAPYSYQWYEGTSALAGETSNQLTVTKGAAGSFSYYCSVEDSFGTTVNSNTVSLTVIEPLTASVTPASATVTTGQSATFTVSASGGVPPYTYQWYEGTIAMAGKTSTQLQVTTSATGSYSYYCNVTDSEGRTIKSNTVSLTVNAPSSTGTTSSSGTTSTPTPTPSPTPAPTPTPTPSPSPTPTASPTPSPTPPPDEGISLWVVGGAVAGIGVASAVFGFMLLKRPKKPPAPAQLRITAEPASIVANGTTKSVITLQLLDKKGKPISAPNDTEVKISAAKGKLENSTVVVPKGKDAEQTVIVSSKESGQVPVSAEADGLKSVTITLNFVERKRYCMHCGALMVYKAKVCQNCGKTPPAGVDTKVCHNCKAVIPAVAKFCSECASGQKE